MADFLSVWFSAFISMKMYMNVCWKIGWLNIVFVWKMECGWLEYRRIKNAPLPNVSTCGNHFYWGNCQASPKVDKLWTRAVRPWKVLTIATSRLWVQVVSSIRKTNDIILITKLSWNLHFFNHVIPINFCRMAIRFPLMSMISLKD